MWRYISGSSPPQKKLKTPEEKKEGQKIYDSQKRIRKFQESWKGQFFWLSYENDRMYCNLCRRYESSGTFVTGCTNFKLESIKAHDVSDGHTKNVSKEKAKNALPGTTEGDKTLVMINKSVYNKLMILFRNAHSVAKNGRPYTDYVNLCQLDHAKGLEIGETYINDKYCQKFVTAIAETRRLEQNSVVKEAPYLSIISDGSTDTSSKEAEIVYMKTSNKCQVFTFFIGLKNVPKADGENISKGISSLLTDRFGNCWEDKIIAMGTDGASVMLGKNTGVIQRIREITDRPYIRAIHCSAHRLELAYKDAIKIPELKIHQKCESLLLNLYLFYKYSPLNRANLKASFVSLGEKMVVPTRVGGTRWLPHTERAIKHILKGYKAVTQHLEQMQGPSDFHKESSDKARNFLKLLKDKDIIYWLHLMMDVVKCLSQVSETIQDRSSTLADIWVELESAKQILHGYTNSDGPWLRKVTSLEDRSFAYMENRKTKLMHALIENISQRFAGDIHLFKACSILNLEKWPKDLRDFGNEGIRSLISVSEEALRGCKADVDIDLIESEWTRFKTSLTENRKDMNPNTATWSELYHYAKDGKSYPNLFCLINYMLTLPGSSVDAERGFSKMKMVKNDWRSRLGEKNLSDLMIVSLESEDVSQFDPSAAVHLWYSGGVRAKRPFYKDEVKKANTTNESIVLPSANESEEEDVAEIPEEMIDEVHADMAQDTCESSDSDSDTEFDSYTLRDMRELQNKSYRMLQDLL